MFCITYHGGDGSTTDSGAVITADGDLSHKCGNVPNNVSAYDDKGTCLSDSVLTVQPDTQLDELRGLYFHDTYLYVVNGGKNESNVLCFRGSGLTYTQESGTVISGTTVTSIKHPFALAFNDRTCFVSNQDTNVVIQLTMKSPTCAETVKGAAASHLRHHYATGTFLDGTFVASSNGALPYVPKTPPITAVPSDQGGLCVSLVAIDQKVKVQHSVRDIVLAGQGTPSHPLLLYVADEPGNLIRLYDATSGKPCGVSNTVKGPTHLLVHHDHLYVSAGHKIFKARLVSTPGNHPMEQCLDLQPIVHEVNPAKPALAGMTIDAAGNFYVALRTESKIVRYAHGDFSQPSVWLTCTTPNPEFIVFVAT